MDWKKLIGKVKNHSHTKFFSRLIMNSIIYGLLINYTVYFIFGLPFTPFTPLAWGTAYYMVFVELPVFFGKIFPRS